MQVGILPTDQALKLAEQSNLDLVEVAPDANPPVSRIMDYGKFRYEQTKREREAKKKQHIIKVKEIKLRPTIDDHDYQTKLRHMMEFLTKGDKVKVVLVFKGREMAHTEIGQKLFDRMIKDVQTVGQLESRPKMLGRIMIMVFAPQRDKLNK